VDCRREGGEHQDGMTLYMRGPPACVEPTSASAAKFHDIFRRDTPAEAEFRLNLRTWLEANLPVALRGRTARPRHRS